MIYSEDLGVQDYSGVKLHCCLNIYKRNPKGLNNKITFKLKDVKIYSEDEKIYNNILEDFKICRMGAKCGVILNDNQKLRNFKVVVCNKNLINIIKESLYAGWNKNILNISTPHIVKDDIYKYLKEQIEGIE